MNFGTTVIQMAQGYIKKVVNSLGSYQWCRIESAATLSILVINSERERKKVTVKKKVTSY